MTITATQTFTVVDPGCCGVKFAMNDSMLEARKNNHRTWYCPNCGCHLHYPGESEEERLRRQLEHERDVSQSRAEQLRRQEYRTRAAKANLTKFRKRVGKGVCPCCNRTFQNLARHMASQHPEEVAES